MLGVAEMRRILGISQHLRECRTIEQSQIQSLPRQRVHDVRGIAQQYRARTHVIHCVLQLQRKARQLGRELAPSQYLAAGLGQSLSEAFGIHGAQVRCLVS